MSPIEGCPLSRAPMHYYYHSTITLFLWIIIAERLSARQLILHRISPSVCMSKSPCVHALTVPNVREHDHYQTYRGLLSIVIWWLWVTKERGCKLIVNVKPRGAATRLRNRGRAVIQCLCTRTFGEVFVSAHCVLAVTFVNFHLHKLRHLVHRPKETLHIDFHMQYDLSTHPTSPPSTMYQ